MCAAVARHVLVGESDAEVQTQIADLVGALGLVVVSAAAGAEILAALDVELPALVLLAVDLGGPCAYEVLHRLRGHHGGALRIALMAAGAGAEERDEVAALLLGADDYFAKPLHADLFLARVRRMVDAAGAVSGPNGSRAARQPGLTNRELEVLALLAEGHRSHDIAERLCITRKTAATHIERILTKLGVHSQAQAVSYALRHRLVEAVSEQVRA
jgi:DNA-binding NarL/FixJ family response regulator